MRNTKNVFKIFMPEDYEKEEQFLHQMSLDGWHFSEVIFGVIFKFEKGEPKNYYYNMDYRNIKKDEQENYYSLFADNEWIFVCKSKSQVFIDLNYFRKESKDGIIPNIFTDNDSKIMFFKNILKIYLLIAALFTSAFLLKTFLFFFIKTDFTYIAEIITYFPILFFFYKIIYKTWKKVKELS